MSPSFADLGVPRAVSDLAARGIATPFPIQAATLPDALAGRDICGRAPTGSGKTIAFGIPLVDARRPGRAPAARAASCSCPPASWPRRSCDELDIARPAPKARGSRPFYGGVGFDPQLRALRKGVDIAVACPGRLADLINQGDCRLDDVEFVVIDEADRMADMGFLPEVKRMLDQCRADRQTLLFSATLDGDVDVLDQEVPARPGPPRVRAPTTSDIARAEHLFWNVERADRVQTARRRRRARTGPTVVFCRTKRGADRIAKQLEQRRRATPPPSTATARRPSASGPSQSFHRGQVAGPGRHRRRRPRHPRRRRRVRHPLRPAGRRQGLRPPLGPHRPRRRRRHRRVAGGRRRAWPGRQDPEGARPAHRHDADRPVPHPGGPPRIVTPERADRSPAATARSAPATTVPARTTPAGRPATRARPPRAPRPVSDRPQRPAHTAPAAPTPANRLSAAKRPSPTSRSTATPTTTSAATSPEARPAAARWRR